MRLPEDDDTGFVCKACGRFYADKEVEQWDTRWTDPDSEGERRLLEIIHKCPLCSEIRSYVPNEASAPLFRRRAALQIDPPATITIHSIWM
jgi:hypothetical protein